MQKNTQNQDLHHVVIIGGGFGGLYTAKALGRAKNVKVTLIDKRNFHLFQPLLYQVATGSLSPGDIASPLRGILGSHKNTKVMMAEVIDIDPEQQKVILKNDELTYDTLIMATGVSHHYFGKDEWQELAPGLKTVEDALEMRRRILSAFEAAQDEPDPEKRLALQRFVIVGGGSTGVELAGAVAQIAHKTLRDEFQEIDTTQSEIYLLQANERLLPNYSPNLSAAAESELKRLGVIVKTNTRMTGIDNNVVSLKSGDITEQIHAKTILWAAGVKASRMGQVIKDRTGVELDRAGRVVVEPDLSVANYPNIFVIGDLANFSHQNGEPLPGVAPVAMRQGEYMANLIKNRLAGRTMPDFHYTDRGSLAVIGRNAAVVDVGFFQFTGFPAWLIWTFLHIYFLIEFDNKVVVFVQWAWSYLTHNNGVRLITGKDSEPTENAEVPRQLVAPIYR